MGARDDLLDLETRRRVFEYVQRFPGLHLREIARGTELHPNHVKYHLQYLERFELVSGRKEEGYWRFFPREEGSLGLRETVAAGEKQLLSLLRQPVPLHAICVLLDRGHASQGELAQAVGVAQPTLHYHVGKMERAGLIRSQKTGRERFYEVADARRVVELLVRFRPPDVLVAGFLEAWESLDLDVRSRERATTEPVRGSLAAQGQAEGEG